MGSQKLLNLKATQHGPASQGSASAGNTRCQAIHSWSIRCHGTSVYQVPLLRLARQLALGWCVQHAHGSSHSAPGCTQMQAYQASSGMRQPPQDTAPIVCSSDSSSLLPSAGSLLLELRKRWTGLLPAAGLARLVCCGGGSACWPPPALWLWEACEAPSASQWQSACSRLDSTAAASSGSPRRASIWGFSRLKGVTGAEQLRGRPMSAAAPVRSRARGATSPRGSSASPSSPAGRQCLSCMPCLAGCCHERQGRSATCSVHAAESSGPQRT